MLKFVEREDLIDEADGVFNGRQLAGGVDHDVEPLTVRIHENELLNAFGGWVDHEVGTELVSEGALRRDRLADGEGRGDPLFKKLKQQQAGQTPQPRRILQLTWSPTANLCAAACGPSATISPENSCSAIDFGSGQERLSPL